MSDNDNLNHDYKAFRLGLCPVRISSNKCQRYDEYEESQLKHAQSLVEIWTNKIKNRDKLRAATVDEKYEFIIEKFHEQFPNEFCPNFLLKDDDIALPDGIPDDHASCIIKAHRHMPEYIDER